MHRSQTLLSRAILVAGLSISLLASLAAAEIKSRFDLPAESLAQALRDFAIQANCNISYEPSVVADLQAPAIKGEFTAADALSRILTGTRLTVVSVNADTLRTPRPATARGAGRNTLAMRSASPMRERMCNLLRRRRIPIRRTRRWPIRSHATRKTSQRSS
jgi:hypothetical protein